MIAALPSACADGLHANAARFLAFVGPGPIEFQILGAPDRYSPNRFSHARSTDEALALLDVAEKLSPVGTYLILNAPDEAVMTRAVAGLWHPMSKGGATTDSDIRARRALYIDVDAKRVSGTSATEAELACALATTGRVYDLLAEHVGHDALAAGHSGNGGSVFIALDALPESPELAALCKGVLTALALRFGNDPGSAIDTTVCDAKRLCPAFGTTKRKGAPGIPERPHRSTGIATPDAPHRLSFAELHRLLGALYDGLDASGRAAVDKSMGRRPLQLSLPNPSPQPNQRDPFALAKAVPIHDVLSWLSLIDASGQPTCPGCGLTDHGVAVVKNGLKCSHNRCAQKGLPPGFRTTIDVVLEACKLEKAIDAVRLLGDRFGFEIPALPPRTPAAPSGATASPDGPPAVHRPLTDLGNAERFVAAHGRDFRYCAGLGWLVYDGKRWARDETCERMRRAILTVRSIYAEAATLDDQKAREATAAWAKRSEAAERLSAVVRVAGSDAALAIPVSALDADPWALNVQNGTLDLRTGELKQHRREDLLTKIAGTSYDPAATCPVFERFLAKVFQEDAELIGFVRRFMGYSLTASVREQVLAFFYGAGANGKSTLIDLMIDLLGSNEGYAKPAAPGLLIAKKSETHPTELADLRGARLVTCVEIGDGKRFDEERVKALTGGDAIKARLMREDFFTFMPTHKLLVAANHRPTVRGTDHAIWRRILLVPFNVTFTGAEKDPELPAKLRTELPGILRWAVEGCLEWQRGGLNPPSTVLEATREYRSAQDIVGAFIAEKCVVRNYASAGASELYALYRGWATAAGEVPMTQTRFGLSLGERGLVRERTRKQFIWRGVGVLTEADDRVSERVGGVDASSAANTTSSATPFGDPLCDEPVAMSGSSTGAQPSTDGDQGDQSTPKVHISSYREVFCTPSLPKNRSHGSQDTSSPTISGVSAGDRLPDEGSPTVPTDHPPPASPPLDDLLARLRHVAPKIRVDAAGNLAGFGTLASWPEGLADELELHRDAIREALLAARKTHKS